MAWSPSRRPLITRRKRRHRKKRSPARLEQLEWSAHVQHRRHLKQKPVTPDAPSVGVDAGVKHAATTQDNGGRIAHHHYTGTRIKEHQQRVRSLRRRRAECIRRSQR